MERGPDDERVAIVCIIVLVVALLSIRACLPLTAAERERPVTPPESFYTPGGEQ